MTNRHAETQNTTHRNARCFSTLLATAFAAVIGTAVHSPSAHAQAPRPAQTFGYDLQGNLTSRTDALNRSTLMSYDGLNRPTQVLQPAPTAGASAPLIQMGYDGRDRLVALTDPRNLTTRITIDGLGNRTRNVSPDTGLVRNSFDPAGNLASTLDARNASVTYTYDAANRPVRAQYSDGTATQYIYDEGTNGRGRLTRMLDPAAGVQTSWRYDINGRVLSRTQTINVGAIPRTHTVSYSYNTSTGQLDSLIYPSGRPLQIAYDPATKQIGSLRYNNEVIATNIVYHGNGRVRALTLGNGVAWTSSLDQDGRVASHTLGGGTVAIAYDAASRIRSLSHSTDSLQNKSFGYGDLDRITSFASGPRDQSFSYDASGNLLSKTDRIGSTAPQTYTYGIDAASNRLIGITNLGIANTFDASGNLINDGAIAFTYIPVGNSTNRLRRATRTIGGIVRNFNYTYNGLGQRVRKSGVDSIVTSSQLLMMYDEAGRLIGEYDNLGRARWEYVWLNDQPLAMVRHLYDHDTPTPRQVEVMFIEVDHLNTPHRLTDGARNARWTWNSAPYGDTLPNEAPAGLDRVEFHLRFAGQYYDVETGLLHNGFRDYDSTSGRYVQSDPIGIVGGINTYLYANGNPLSFVDPLGLMACGARVLYHYTDEEGARGIVETGITRADARGRVFLTDQKLSSAEVQDRLFIGRSGNKGSHVVEIQTTDGLSIRQGKNANELIHQGAIRDGRQGIFKVKPNDF